MSDCTRSVVLCLVLLFTSQVEAQIANGDMRVYLDTDLFNYERTQIEKPGEREIERQVDVGPGGSAITASLPGVVGVGIGYALHRHFVSSLHFSFARHQAEHERYFERKVQPTLREPTVSSFMLRPEFEVPLNPRGRAVVGVMAGFDIRKWNERAELSAAAAEVDRQTLGFGPVGGVTSHFFVVREASIDLSLVAVVDFVDASGNDPWFDAERYVKFSLSLMLGISLWP